MQEITINFDEDGAIRFIHDGTMGELLDQGVCEVRRASHVEPINPVLRVVFRALRAVWGDHGWVAGFTRVWCCRWRVNLRPSNGPILAPFNKRADALGAEVNWLREHGY